MNAPDPKDIPSRISYPSDSLDCEILDIDTPGDRTIRPSRPALVRLAMLEKEREARARKFLEEQSESDSEKD